MTELEKELFIESLKQSFRNNNPKEVADDLCAKLDVVKHNADVLELIFKLQQSRF